MLSRRIGLLTAVFIVMTSMIGTGIFVTTGDVLAITKNSLVVLILWLVGGVIALCGSLSYAEFASMMPRSGGEYTYLKNTFGTLPAFLSGWVSLLVGFSASIAISAIALQLYTEKLFASLLEIYPGTTLSLENSYIKTFFAPMVIILIGFVHAFGIRLSIRIQNLLSVFKIVVMILFIIFGFLSLDFSHIDRLFADYSKGSVNHEGNTLENISQIGLALLIITFAYSGWNGTSYIAEEIKKPEKNLPKSLWMGTLITIAFYLLTNIVFLTSLSGEELMQTKTVGEASAKAIFPQSSAIIFNGGIIFVLLSSLSVQMMIGPRVYYAMAKDKIIFHSLAKIDEKHQTPKRAIILQMLIVLGYMIFGLDLNWLMTYMGFALSIFPFMTVFGLFYLRRKEPNRKRPYRIPLYPITPALFLAGSLGMMAAALLAWSWSSIVAIIIVLSGVPIFFTWKKLLDMSALQKQSGQ